MTAARLYARFAALSILICAVVACSSHEAPPPEDLAQQSSAIATATDRTSPGVKVIDGVWPLLRTFFNSKAFLKQCGVPGGATCLSDQDVDGNGGATSPTTFGCWYNNSCKTLTGAAPYRRPTTVAGKHEGRDVLAPAIAELAKDIRRNRFAPPLGAKPTDPNYSVFGGNNLLPSLEWAFRNTNLNSIKYRLGAYYDRNMDRMLIAVEPDTNWNDTGSDPADADGRNWGLFIFNTQARHYCVVEIPHPKYDLNAERLGAEASRRATASRSSSRARTATQSTSTTATRSPAWRARPTSPIRWITSIR